ncbi:UDP-Glycosyltransferase/glycogen phosphorylase [Trametes maxima]|nr:UDP-Glycosyltransferase/glycogen phosphorylase [Trametes maxima]
MAASSAVGGGHIVLLGDGPWAVKRQLCIFATKLAKLRPINVTIFTDETYLERAKREVSSELAHRGGTLSIGCIRIIVLPSDKHKHFVDPVFEAAFVRVYRQLLSGESIQCTATGEQFGPLPAPQAIITSKTSTLETLQKIRAEVHHGAKLIAWYPRVPSNLFFFHGPAERGGVGDVRGKTVSFLDSVLIRIPGYEPIYRHEVQPQELASHGTLGVEWLTTYDMFTACDGVLMPTPECFDTLSLIGARAWMAETGRRAYAVGPILATGPQALENELMEADRGTEIRDFVSRVLKSHGPKSLLYISLGSWMWPKYPDKMWTFLDVVMDLGIPFIMSHASEYAQVPDEVLEKVHEYRYGLLSSWCPQQMILNHPVTAWFVTHCGHCSVMESISAGVPMICWPFVGDGALNAIHLTDTFKCAYELLEVRTGHGLERIYRTGVSARGTPAAVRAEALRVLERAFSPDGEMRRANVLRVRGAFERAWAEGGESVGAAERFLEDLGIGGDN